MLDLEEINNTIMELENGDTTFDTCIKLAALYTVREKQIIPKTNTEKELSDILPAYRKYVDVLKAYQMGNSSDKALLDCTQLVCQELKEFILSLYSSTDGQNFRHYIEETLQDLARQMSD